MKFRTHNFIEMSAEDSIVDLNGARSVLCLSHTRQGADSYIGVV
jgi:hypothetical protein